MNLIIDAIRSFTGYKNTAAPVATLDAHKPLVTETVIAFDLSREQAATESRDHGKIVINGALFEVVKNFSGFPTLTGIPAEGLSFRIVTSPPLDDSFEAERKTVMGIQRARDLYGVKERIATCAELQRLFSLANDNKAVIAMFPERTSIVRVITNQAEYQGCKLK